MQRRSLRDTHVLGFEAREPPSLTEVLRLAQQRHQGFREQNTTAMSISVVRPRVNANPFTAPMAKMKSTSAESSETPSAIRIVCRDRTQPVSIAVRSDAAVADLVPDPFVSR